MESAHRNSNHPAVKYVRDAGWALVSIPRGSKGPKTRGWNRAQNTIRTPKAAARLNGHNVGLVHEWSGTCAIDVDGIAQARPWLAGQGIDLDELLAAPDAVQIVSGRPNRAKLLYRLPKGVKPLPHRKLADGALELRCAGVQDVLPPSIHPDTGKPYEWLGDWRHLPTLPQELLKLWRDQSTTHSHGMSALTADEVVYALMARSLYRKDAGGGKHLIACPWDSEHTTNGGTGETAYFQPHTNGFDKPAFKCFHSHCAERTIRDLRVHLNLDQEIRPGDEQLMQRRYTLAELLEDAVYLSKRDTITLLSASTVDCSAEHFKRLLAASTDSVMTSNGPRVKYVSELWLAHPNRKTTAGRTFAPGAGVLCKDPDGDTAVNTWRPIDHKPPRNWRQRSKPFLDHIKYLVPNTEERNQIFLWLAHLIQRPGGMPPWHVVMYTDGAQGVGRNWLAAVIGRVVQPYAALHVDIGALAGTAHGIGFNGALAGKLFACVDELHASAFAAGGRRMMETLKTTLTAETRLLNPKYGRQTVEFNRLRVLILSNHCGAMPLDSEDRRFLVIRNPDAPKSSKYYTDLYQLLGDDEFIASVWHYLNTHDVSHLALGRAPMTTAKKVLIEATEPDYVTAIREAIERNGNEVITTTQLKAMSGISAPWQVQHAMKALGAVKYPRRVRLKTGRQERVWIVRDHERWLYATPDAVAGVCQGKSAKSTKSVPFKRKFLRRGNYTVLTNTSDLVNSADSPALARKNKERESNKPIVVNFRSSKRLKRKTS